MKKATKMIIAVVAILATLVAMAGKSSAMTQSELKDYVTSEKGISNTNVVIRDSDKVKVEKFFSEITMTDEQADQIKAIIDEAIAFMTADGATTPNAMSTKAKKQELFSYAEKAASILGLEVSYDASEERLDIYKDGKLYDSLFWGVTKDSTATTEPSLVQTGATNYVYVVVAGVVLVAGITLVVARKKALNATK